MITQLGEVMLVQSCSYAVKLHLSCTMKKITTNITIHFELINLPIYIFISLNKSD